MRPLDIIHIVMDIIIRRLGSGLRKQTFRPSRGIFIVPIRRSLQAGGEVCKHPRLIVLGGLGESVTSYEGEKVRIQYSTKNDHNDDDVTYLRLLDMLVMQSNPLLSNLPRPPLQVRRQVCRVIFAIRTGNDPGGVVEQVVHLLQRQELGFREDDPEVDGVGEVEDDEEHIVLPAHALNSEVRHLADHGVEAERYHGCDGDALRAGVRVEYFGGYDVRKGTAGGREGYVVEPCAMRM